MQTRCPTCETIFRFTKAQATAASGMVQCGVCHGFFNAMNNRCDGSEQVSGREPGKPAHTGGVISGVNASGRSDMPAVLAEGYVLMRPTVPWWTTVFWSLVILLGLIGILGQMAWFNVNQLSNQAGLKSYIEKACQHVPCGLEKQRDLEKIELLSRDVRSHPTRQGALLVTATFINRADFDQPYPRIALTLSNLTGEIVAFRHFLPQEYLGDDFDSRSMMTVGVPATMIMEVLDPGNETVSYRFDFL